MLDEDLQKLKREDEFRYIVAAERAGIHPKPTITSQETLNKFAEIKKAPFANFKTKNRKFKIRSEMQLPDTAADAGRFLISDISEANPLTYYVKGKNWRCNHKHATRKNAIKCGLRHVYSLEKKKLEKGLTIPLKIKKEK